MNRKQIWALVIIGLCAVILIMTRGSTDVNLIYDVVSGRTSLVLLASITIGVVIGLLLK